MSDPIPAQISGPDQRLEDVWDGATRVTAHVLGHRTLPPRRRLQGGGALRWLNLDGVGGPYASFEFIPESQAGEASPLRLVVSERTPGYADLRSRLRSTSFGSLIEDRDRGFEISVPYERVGSAQDAADQVSAFVLDLRNQVFPLRPVLVPTRNVDITFDVESDANGKDPDQHSPTLRRYHQLLWSKTLPGGSSLRLESLGKHTYLRYATGSAFGYLASDSIIHSYRDGYTNNVGGLMKSVDSRLTERVHRDGSTVGGFILFPGDVRNRQPTINGARGMHARICDRFDLTLECIRRYYAGESSPLHAALDRYGDFFALFEDFRGYIEFFLLQDLVDEKGQVTFYLPFDDFERSALPQTVQEYGDYASGVLRFLHGRNSRIEDWAAMNLS